MDYVLSLPDFDLTFILETDASDNCLGAALIQKIEGKYCPIAFYSRTMTVAEKNYDTSQKELLAIVKAVENFKQFLYGKEFVIKTDHQPLTSIKTKAKPSVRLGRLLSDPKVLSIQRKADWLRNKGGKKTIRDSDEGSNGSGLPSYHISLSPTSSSESEGDIIEYTASSPSQPRASRLRESKSLDLT